MTSEIELLPCPFCGAAAKESYDEKNDEHWVICGHGSCDVEPSVARGRQKDARKAWNRRASIESNPFLESLPLTEEAVAAQVEAIESKENTPTPAEIRALLNQPIEKGFLRPQSERIEAMESKESATGEGK